MNMFWSRKLSSEWRSGAVVHMLRAATIAAVVSSCFTSSSRVALAQAGEPLTPPLVIVLAPDSELAARIKDYAWTHYEALEDKGPYRELLTKEDQLEFVVDVTITYKDSKGEERLLSLAPTLPNPNSGWTANCDTIRIPTGPNAGDFKPPPPAGNGCFREVTITETHSPATTTKCTSNSGGTQYACF
jgi:hypothetical protein